MRFSLFHVLAATGYVRAQVPKPGADGKYTISSSSIKAQFIPYGATLTNLFVKDKNGEDVDVVLGYEDLAYYAEDPGHPVYNSIPGRYVNRIGHGKYSIDNNTYTTELNDGTNTLHSGTNNWSYRTWNVTAATNDSITFTVRDESNSSKGMPGLVLANVTYSVNGDRWDIKMDAVSPGVKSHLEPYSVHAIFETIPSSGVTGLWPTGEMANGGVFDCTPGNKTEDNVFDGVCTAAAGANVATNTKASFRFDPVLDMLVVTQNWECGAESSFNASGVGFIQATCNRQGDTLTCSSLPLWLGTKTVYSAAEIAGQVWPFRRSPPSELHLHRAVFPPFRETLNIQIIETNVDEVAGEYDTLSYCWGDGAVDRTIIVSLSKNREKSIEYRAIHVSASLESALLSLARKTNIEASRPIFADQICINQCDNAEKVQQVRLMGEVYAKGAKNVIWLGEGTIETSRYFDFLSELSSEGILSRVMGPNVAHCMKVFDAVMDSSIGLETEAEREDRDDILDLVARYGPRFPLRGLTEMLRRAWLNRLWTVQEGCLPTNLTFRCGEKSLCYDCVRGGLLFHSIWTTYGVAMPQGPVSQEEIQARNEIYGLSETFHRIISGRKTIHGAQAQRRSLYDTVVLYNVNGDRPKIGATKAEDRIYALLGLAADDAIAKETVREMEVDNVRGTFTKFASSAIKINADVLLFSQMPKSPAHGHHLPSWVPDWSADPLRMPYGYAELTTPVFSAGGSRSDDDIVADASTGVLRVNAILVGHVVRVGARGIQSDESATLRNIEFMSTRHFFDEVDEFMEEATRISATHAPDISDEQHRLDSTIRLSDGGLSTRQFPTQFDPTTSAPLLQEIHRNVSLFGKKLIDVEAQTRSLSSFTGMIRNAGVMPWHWTPASEIDTIRLCAIDPIAAAGAWIRGFSLTIRDVGLVVWYIAKLRFVTAMVRLRQKRGKLDFRQVGRDVALKNMGLNSDLPMTQEWNLYTSNLFKNIGRKLFLTDTGYVGLGPSHAGVGDAIAVIPGSSVPHILRPLNVSSWTYVGEAYCDGIMDGELVANGRDAMIALEIV
ncbi:hypothetical protein O1611_g1889 [Lasiodiplodia mahajangana]|uniref:Uncharacterized protein n=1 Tax=Lasiodiplodia mahajangana TaxID=1108764 RepID=A0ACC2JW64_9PEZI|nr:hypothetical protein O1611_g1889 [Lasiodiplodia mahajangana]